MIKDDRLGSKDVKSERGAGDSASRFLRGQPPRGRVARRWPLLILAVAGLLLLLYPLLGDNGLTAYFQLRGERARLQREVETLEDRRSELQDQIDALQNDPAALEKLARERYNMQRPDEQVLLVKPDESENDRAP